MATEQYPYLSGVRSNLIEEQIRQEVTPPTPRAIIIFGTAQKGPLYTPTRIDASNAVNTFGANVSDPYERFNLMKGFYEITGSMPNTEVIGVRIGAAKKATLPLYEHQVTSGIYAPQAVDTLSVTLEALTDGNDGNSITADVYGDTAGIPTRLIIGLPTGVSVEFDLVNTYKTPTALAAAINSDDDVAGFIRATANVLSASEDIVITEDVDVSGQIEQSYSLSERNIIDLTAVYLAGEYVDSDSIPAGRSSATLAKTPVKDTNPSTATISKFWSIVNNETVASSTAPDTDQVTLDCAADVRWTKGESDSLKELVVSVKDPATGVISAKTEGVDFTISTLGVITFSVALATGSYVYATYKYLTSFSEANVRSSLSIGDPYSYFVGGDTVTFGASQPLPIEVAYNTKDAFSIPGDVTLYNAEDGTVKFSINGNEPAIGDTVTFSYVYEAELPAPRGTVLPSGKRQASQLSAGTDGRRITLPDLYNELAKGYLAADNTPFRIAIPQGVYVDDVMDGIDFETGLPTTMNAGFHTQLSAFLARHSQYVSECIGIMSVRPMATSNPTAPSLEEREDWYNNLVTVSATNGTVASNVVSAINDYHIVVLAGDLILSHPSINGGKLYVEGGQNIFAAMKYHHDNLTSIVSREIPQILIRGMQYRIVSSDKVNTLNGMRYTLITEDSDNGALRVASAPTMAAPTSQFRKQYNLDITMEAVNVVRSVLKPFIGQPNKPSVRESMRQRAKQELQLMSPDKLMSFDVIVSADRTDAINGKAQVQLLLVTAVEIQQIIVTTRLQLGF